MQIQTINLLLTVVLFTTTTACGATYAIINITSDPSGAHVYSSSGNYLGQTPTGRQIEHEFVIGWNSCGNYEVTLKSPGYIDATQSVDYCATQTSLAKANENPYRIHVLMTPSSKKQSPTKDLVTEVSITSSPTGASVYGDGTYWGQTPYTGRVRWRSKITTVDVRVEMPGYRTEIGTLSLGNQRIHVVLQPTTAAPR